MSSWADIAQLVDNRLDYVEGRSFAAILGANPSKGARSPLLWNAAFRAHGVDAEMVPLDVPRERLTELLSALQAHPSFIGGAIAVPHKEAVAQWLGAQSSPEAIEIGAVNCLYRGPSGQLSGTNTDGEGALRSFEEQCGKVAGKRVLVLGLGGAGKAVAAFFRRAVQPCGALAASTRSSSGKETARQLGAEWCAWSEIGNRLHAMDVVINCTSVGHGERAGESPLDREQLAQLPPNAQVFDIIYQPSPTLLLAMASERGLRAVDGTGMNLEQAVLAYGHANPRSRDSDVTRAAMIDAKRRAEAGLPT